MVCLTHSFGIPCLGFRIGIDSSADSVVFSDNFDSAWVAVIVIRTYYKIHSLLGLGRYILDSSFFILSFSIVNSIPVAEQKVQPLQNLNRWKN